MSKFDELMSVLKKNIVFVQTHNYPDQDALATAQGLKTLIESRGKQAIICYKGQIDKYNTIKMIELLNIEVVPADSIEFRDDDEIILVDCQKGNINVKGYCGHQIACIDHHKLDTASSYLFRDIRPNVGACSSIITEYLIENNVHIDYALATVLAYGIRMDTNLLSRNVSDLDIDMYSYLYKLSNKKLLRKLDVCTLRIKDLDSYYNAITNLKIYDHVAFVNVGANCSESTLGQVCDFLITLKELEFIVVHSYRDGGIKFSVRSEDPRLDAAEIIKHALSDSGDGGGHATMAAGFIPDIQNAASAVTISLLIEERFLEIIGQILKIPNFSKINKSGKSKSKKGRHLLPSVTFADNQ